MESEGIFRRRHLPHWDVEGEPIFITACLEGSVSAAGLSRIRRYRDELYQRPRPPDIIEHEWERKKHKLPAGQNAVVARWINTKEVAGRLAKEAGLQTGDLIIELNGKPVPSGGGAVFSTLVKLNYKPGQKLPLTVWRDGKRVKLEVPLVK